MKNSFEFPKLIQWHTYSPDINPIDTAETHLIDCSYKYGYI